VKKTVWLALAFAVIVVMFIVVTSFRPKVKCQVCMAFNGGRDCRTGVAETRETALRTAVTNACAMLAGGVTETNQCENTHPESVEWLQ
jgi:hypothetical protein